MAYDPSGDPRLEGEEILKRLAEGIGVDVIKLEAALRCLVRSYKKGVENYPELVKNNP